jgi:hypothetical protein
MPISLDAAIEIAGRSRGLRELQMLFCVGFVILLK